MTILHRTRQLLSVAALAGAALLAGCASLNSVDTSVATFGAWPADTAPGTYAFDRLPSQERNPQRQQSVENAAAQALAGAGFRPAAEGTKPAVMIQLGVRTERFEQARYDENLQKLEQVSVKSQTAGRPTARTAPGGPTAFAAACGRRSRQQTSTSTRWRC